MSRIEAKFSELKSQGRKALITFVMGGDPNLEACQGILNGLPEAGADLIEIGMPFTDPVADGPAIQLAGQRALAGNTSLDDIFTLVENFRDTNNDTPVILMGYANPVHIYGTERFIEKCKNNGVDGVIIVDFPPEESGAFSKQCNENGVDFVRLVTPTTDEARLVKILDGASGFLYYVSITGVTGTAKADISKIRPHIDMIRAHTDLPIALGFGIKTPDDVRAMAPLADACVVGSAIVSLIPERGAQACSDSIHKLVQDLKQPISS